MMINKNRKPYLKSLEIALLKIENKVTLSVKSRVQKLKL